MSMLIGLAVGIAFDLIVVYTFNVQDLAVGILIGLVGGIISLLTQAYLEERA